MQFYAIKTSAKQVQRMSLLFTSKRKIFCLLTFLRMASKCYANYIDLVITNNCNTHSYVGRR